MTKQDVRFYESRITHFENDIATEVDLLFEMGKLFIRRPHERFQTPSSQRQRFRTAKGRSVSPEQGPCPLGEDEGGLLDKDGEQENDGNEPFSITRAEECFSDCIEECCEDTSFDIENVMNIANEFFRF